MTRSEAVNRIGLLLTIAVLGVSLISFLCEPTKLALIAKAKIAANITVPEDYAKISWAVGNASAGDTILVKSGVYNESGIIVDKTLTITGESAETTVIDGEGTEQNVFFVTADAVVIENFTLQNTDQFHPFSTVYLYNVTNVILKNLIIWNAFYGMQVRASNFTTVADCIISGSYNSGIYLNEGSGNDTFAGNTVRNNPSGITFASAAVQFNRVYHNNFINNSESYVTFGGLNYFDNGYPSGGNYWSDSIGVDFYGGLRQNETGSDGILDTSYPSDISPLDRFPFANLIANLEILAYGQTFLLQVSTNGTITGSDFNISKKSLYLLVNGSPGTVSGCRVSIPKALLSTESLSNWTVTLYQDGQRLGYSAFEDAENTYLYVAYNNTATTDMIEMMGNFAISEFPSLLITLLISFSIGTVIIAFRRLPLPSKGSR